MNDDIYDLIIHLLIKRGYNEDFLNERNEAELENLLYNEYDIYAEVFENLTKDLLPLCFISKSELTDKVYQGFGTDNLWLMKREVK